ncbi:hypothetical protein KOM00_05560 [Geomonas sp. Red69]|uniref:hypothetical protein n=1 Tax=Geomonas diazotrophica TaxID=2843197 RepID=UPI001C10ACBE|nr:MULTISPECIES: hypothetical protein [Geomonas]MBU5636194.1 hypothetical protein [Geomonas diazotrophica]QXE85159.1 hypothetical protein KP003_12210 [Geomonas nitrogeniifigens]
MGSRIVRDYHNMPPTKFHEFNQGVVSSLADKTRFPDSFWGVHPTLVEYYLAASAKHDAVYHESMLGSRVVIAERELLQAQLVLNLDEVASILEMAAVRNPEILLASGFTLAKEKRGRARTKAANAALSAARAAKEGEEGGTPT